MACRFSSVGGRSWHGWSSMTPRRLPALSTRLWSSFFALNICVIVFAGYFLLTLKCTEINHTRLYEGVDCGSGSSTTVLKLFYAQNREDSEVFRENQAVASSRLRRRSATGVLETLMLPRICFRLNPSLERKHRVPHKHGSSLGKLFACLSLSPILFFVLRLPSHKR